MLKLTKKSGFVDVAHHNIRYSMYIEEKNTLASLYRYYARDRDYSRTLISH